MRERRGNETVSETGARMDADPALAATAVDDSGDGPGATAPAADPLIGAAVDRYRVVARLGAGGMGVVYAAHDPALDRRVALKVLPPLSEARRGPLETRLRREAQALAQVDHPNVVSVYDVGIAERSVFVAMQLVDGTTLAEHLEAAPRSPREIVALFLAAGGGLAAAHAAGIVHRDVKPRNILVDRAGRAYIGDFGLARATDASAATTTGPIPLVATGPIPLAEPDTDRDGRDDQVGREPADAAEVREASSGERERNRLLDAHMTRAGAVIGTPAYLSPEQLRGEPATARSDQFAFCVSLWIALFGRHPFVDGPWTAAAAEEAMRRDAIRTPLVRYRAGTRSGPPASRVVRALRRGLRHDPAARWPSMTALLAALAPRSRTAWIVGGLAAAGIVAAVLVTARLSAGPDRAATCELGGERLAAIWPARAASVAGAGPNVARALDAYAAQWTAMRRDACAAATAADTAALADQQVRCLDDQLRIFDQLVTDLGAADAPSLLRSRELDAIAALPAPSACAGSALALLPPVPLSALVPVSDVRADLAHAHTIALASRVPEARALIDRSLATARSLGYPPLVAEALLAKATLADQDDDARTAALADEAAEIATAARADRTAAQAYALALLTAAESPDFPRMAALLPVARAAARRVDDPSTTRLYAKSAARAAIENVRYDDAAAACAEIRAQIARTAAGDPARDEVAIDADACTASIAFARQDLPAAEAAIEHWRALETARYGTDTLGTLPSLRMLSTLRARQGNFTEALTLAAASLDVTTRALGADSLEQLDDLSALAQLQHYADQPAAATATGKRLEALLATTKVATVRQTVVAEMSLAELARVEDLPADTQRHAALALAAGARGLPADSPKLATARLVIGVWNREDGNLDLAEQLIAQAEAAFTRTGDPHRFIAEESRAELYAVRGRCAEAIAPLEDAAAGLARFGFDRLNLLRARLLLARCTWMATPAARPRATADLDLVLADLAALGPAGSYLRNEALAWRAAHRTGPVEQRTPGTLWANAVRAVTSEAGAEGWSALQALGAPDAYPVNGSSETAWEPKQELARETLELGYPASRARGVRVYETMNPGAVVEIAVLAGGAWRTVYRAAPRLSEERPRILAADFACGAQPIVAVRVTLDAKALEATSEIDAVGLVTCP